MEPNQTTPEEIKGAARKCPAVLPSDARLSDNDWPGVVWMISDEMRVALNVKGNRYALQTCVESESGPIWVGALYSTASSLLNALAKTAPERAREAVALPESPRDVLAEFREAAKAAADAWQALDTRRDDYAWVLRKLWQVEPFQPSNPDLAGQGFYWLRLIVTPDRQFMLQSSVYGSHWFAVVVADTPCQLAAVLRRDPVPVQFSAAQCFEALEWMAELWREALCNGRALSLLNGVSGDFDALDLPEMPERPPISERRRPAHKSRTVRNGRPAAKPQKVPKGRPPKKRLKPSAG